MIQNHDPANIIEKLENVHHKGLWQDIYIDHYGNEWYGIYNHKIIMFPYYKRTFNYAEFQEIDFSKIGFINRIEYTRNGNIGLLSEDHYPFVLDKTEKEFVEEQAHLGIHYKNSYFFYEAGWIKSKNKTDGSVQKLYKTPKSNPAKAPMLNNIILNHSFHEFWFTAADNVLIRYSVEDKCEYTYDTLSDGSNLQFIKACKSQQGDIYIVMGREENQSMFKYNRQKDQLDLFLEHVKYKIHTNFKMARNDSMAWFTTYFGLLCVDLNTKTQRLVSFKKNNSIVALHNALIDHHGKLWINSSFGLLRYDPATKDYFHFTKSDGFPTNEFTGAAFKDDNGYMYFAYREGVVFFHPDSISTDTLVPPVYLTGLELFNKPLKPGHNKYLKKNIAYTDKIVFPYHKNMLTFKFEVLSYDMPEKNKYAYMLEGIDDKWIHTSKNEVTYTALSPGKYIFKVKGANHHNVWNDKPAMITVHIKPPFWKTWWFRVFVFMVVAIAVGSFFWLRVRNLKRRQKELEKKVTERTTEIQQQKRELEAQSEELSVTNESLQELNCTKDKFFNIIAHDLKNPFHAILGFADLAMESKNKAEYEKLAEIIKIIKDSSSEAYALLENLLQWSRSQSNEIAYHPEKFDVNTIIDDTLKVQKVQADHKKISIINKTEDEAMVYADTNMVMTVIRNLVSNAIKFTGTGGKIIVKAFDENDRCKIMIEDTGIGMTEEQVDGLFRIDRQNVSKGTSGETGTGLGLIICKEFIEKNNGDISVESTYGSGSVFTITLPAAGQKEYKELITENETHITDEDSTDDEIITIDEALFKGKTILLVEDNTYILSSLKEIFLPLLEVHTATNGSEGMLMALDHIPDIIVSDVNMPGMDGFEFTHQIKTNEKTNHIPVILLTVKASDDSRIKGIKKGADDYLVKPFSKEVLLTKAESLLKNREILREKYSKILFDDSSATDINDEQDQLIRDIKEVVENNYTDSEFNVDRLAKSMNFSKRQLYRKLDSMLKLSPFELINEIRLQKAAQLLKTTSKTVSEISYEVGFAYPNHFSRAFKKKYGVSPLNYQKK